MHRRLHGISAALLSLSLLAAACGNSGDDDSASTDDSTTTTAAESDDTTPPDDSAPDDSAPDDSAPDDSAPEDAADRDTFVALEGVPGVSDDEIAVAVLGLRENNPLGTCILDCYLTGIQAYFDYQNSLGGVFGRQLVVADVLDDELAQNQAKAVEIIANDDTLVTFGATLNPTGYGDLADAGVPLFNWGIQSPVNNGRETLYPHFGVLCGDCTGRAVPYQMQLAGASTAVSLGYGISPESQTCALNNANAIEQYSDDLGISLAKTYDGLEFGLPNGIAPQVSEWIELGVDFVASCLDLNGMKTIAQELERQNVRDQITLQHPNTYNAEFVAEAGDLFDGDFVSPQFVPFEFTDLPPIQLYNEWVDQQGGPTAEQTMIGWMNATLFVDGLIAAGPEFDRESIVSAINTEFTAYTYGGLLAPIDWSRQHETPTPDDRVTHGAAQECFSIVQMEGGAFQTITDQPWLCWPQEDRSWQEPVQTTFD
ncbi:MAG: ABC transporter substrate-binding protein [Acidimicrobiales bacterium]